MALTSPSTPPPLSVNKKDHSFYDTADLEGPGTPSTVSSSLSPSSSISAGSPSSIDEQKALVSLPSVPDPLVPQKDSAQDSSPTSPVSPSTVASDSAEGGGATVAATAVDMPTRRNLGMKLTREMMEYTVLEAEYM